MFRDQVYNAVGRGSGQLSPNCDTFRRLSRRIHHNMGLLNTSRSSNHSSSFRMRRTELSGERCPPSREHSQQASGYTHDNNHSRNDSSRREAVPRDVNRRRGNYESSRPHPPQQTGGKLLVENLYMLAGNQRQYQNGRDRSGRPPNVEPQSPRSRNFNQLQEERRRDNSSRERQENRAALPSRESRIIQRQRSKQQGRRGNLQGREGSKEHRDRMLMQAELNEKKIYEQEMHRLQEKYRQNVYQLKSPRRKVEKRRSEKQGAQLDHRPSAKASNSTKNMNQYYFQQGQVSSTSGGTAGVKTLPETSKVDTISEASLPVNSVASQKDMLPKESLSPRVHQKNSLRLERNKEKVPNQSRDRRKEKERQPIVSKLSVKRKMNNTEPQPKRVDAKKRSQKVGAEREDEILPLGSVFLPVESRREEGRQWAQDILERIILHLECLNIVADYTKQFRKMYETTEQWQILIFLSYKKFYIERTKIEAVLKAPSAKKEQSRIMQSSENPFILPYSKIGDEELTRFRGSRQCIALRHELEAENTRIRNALRGLYNLYIEKSGEHVNMLDCDNFSEEIYKLMLEELDGISQNLQEPSLVEPTKLRIGKIIRSGLLIAFINGKYVKNFAQMLLHEDIVKIGKRETLRQDCVADLFLSEFKRALS